MTTKIIIPKSTHYGHIIKDEKLLEIIEKKDQDAKNVIDSMTRQYLRQKHPTKIIEGIEKIRGRGVIDVWYEYK